ncbi:hypothetical protein PSP31121_05672 [Pandoraea sputorum]|uniref:Tetratricopeptide repeat protein n=2 Tax=Pandoraea sputorum TaxID=93222 RepID=A0A5E5BNH4_9BURK|nr:hypothetical protein PSP31121_05672 [Pandoraea sputorum]
MRTTPTSSLFKMLTSSIATQTALTESQGSNMPEVDFNDEVSVLAAHRAIQTATETHLPTTFFRAEAEAQCREAIATQGLCVLAQQNEANPVFIPAGPHGCLVTLIRGLSDTGKNELMRSADENTVSNAFSEHLELSDIEELRFRVRCLSEARGYEDAGLGEKAAEYYEIAGLHDLAARSLGNLGDKASEMGQHWDAATCYLKAGEVLMRDDQPASADQYFNKVTDIAVKYFGAPEVKP